ncbi:ACT domain-containing protein [bacterium]|nr:MAG: ACT domain-containing protein [bacterium]
MRLRLHPEEYVVARNESGSVRPKDNEGLFASIIGPDGNTVVCRYGLEPIQADLERGWRAMQIDESLGFGEIGVIASIVGPLAAAGVAVFVISTFSLDWILIKEGAVGLAIEVLKTTGHEVRT